jgi:diguanylate cyclase (GGDEF)-like protein
VVDVNGLKTINDHYGHHHGDEMLTLIASALKNTARSHDTVARVGGDEFYIILENANLETCEQFAERLTSTNNELSMKINGDTLPVSFSFGFASTDMDSLKNLLALADERMYFAKKNHYKALATQS